MEVQQMSSTIPIHPLELEGGLASLSSIAAIEVDALLRGQTTDFMAAKRVSDELSLFAKSRNPASLAVMNLALSDSPFGKTVRQRVDQVVREAENIRERICHLVDDPSSFRMDHNDELVDLGVFLLALSKRAAAFDRPFEQTEPDNPVRR